MKNSNTSEKTYLAEDKNPQLKAASWVQLDVARKLFAASGMNVDTEMEAAGKKGLQGSGVAGAAEGAGREHGAAV